MLYRELNGFPTSREFQKLLDVEAETNDATFTSVKGKLKLGNTTYLHFFAISKETGKSFILRDCNANLLMFLHPRKDQLFPDAIDPDASGSDDE